jgi:hypothetical protein
MRSVGVKVVAVHHVTTADGKSVDRFLFVAVLSLGLGLKVLHRARDDLEEVSKVEQFPKMEGRQMTMVIAPR